MSWHFLFHCEYKPGILTKAILKCLLSTRAKNPEVTLDVSSENTFKITGTTSLDKCQQKTDVKNLQLLIPMISPRVHHWTNEDLVVIMLAVNVIVFFSCDSLSSSDSSYFSGSRCHRVPGEAMPLDLSV